MDNKKENVEKDQREEIKVVEETLEEMLKRLRISRKWSYIELVQELSKVGVMTDEKTVKKWELGLEYPNLDVIYKLSDIYKISSQDVIQAKNNSLNRGYNSVHTRFIKWMCYFTGASMKVMNWLFYLIIAGGLIYALWFFMDKVDFFFSAT